MKRLPTRRLQQNAVPRLMHRFHAVTAEVPLGSDLDVMHQMHPSAGPMPHHAYAAHRPQPGIVHNLRRHGADNFSAVQSNPKLNGATKYLGLNILAEIPPARTIRHLLKVRLHPLGKSRPCVHADIERLHKRVYSVEHLRHTARARTHASHSRLWHLRRPTALQMLQEHLKIAGLTGGIGVLRAR